jgi:hypothetical protein
MMIQGDISPQLAYERENPDTVLSYAQSPLRIHPFIRPTYQPSSKRFESDIPGIREFSQGMIQLYFTATVHRAASES